MLGGGLAGRGAGSRPVSAKGDSRSNSSSGAGHPVQRLTLHLPPIDPATCPPWHHQLASFAPSGLPQVHKCLGARAGTGLEQEVGQAPQRRLTPVEAHPAAQLLWSVEGGMLQGVLPSPTVVLCVCSESGRAWVWKEKADLTYRRPAKSAPRIEVQDDKHGASHQMGHAGRSTSAISGMQLCCGGSTP